MKLRILSHLLKESLMENFVFYAVKATIDLWVKTNNEIITSGE